MKATQSGQAIEWMCGASIVDRDWMQTPSLPWERIPEYVWPEVEQLARSGVPTRAIARMIGYDRRQVIRLIRKQFPNALNARCPCGLNRRHQGWCRVRYKTSEVRQAVMRLLHFKQRATRLMQQGLSIQDVRSKLGAEWKGSK